MRIVACALTDASDITIGRAGSITGFAVTGGVTGSTLTD
jgi:hypothetical protein